MGNKSRRNFRKNKKKHIKSRKKIYLGGAIFNTSSKTTEMLNDLNALLRKKCNNLELRVGMMTEMTGEIYAYSRKLKNSILICLYYNNDCISSIQLMQDDDGNIELRSFTDRTYEGNKYNTLLRNILIVIGNTIMFKDKPIIKVMSYATNPISAHLIMKNFNIFPSLVDSYGNKTDISYFMDKYKQDGKTGDTNTIVQEFYKSNNSVPIAFEIPLTDEGLINQSFDKIKILVGEIDVDNVDKQIKCP